MSIHREKPEDPLNVSLDLSEEMLRRLKIIGVDETPEETTPKKQPKTNDKQDESRPPRAV
jgi:hypothetical protein